MPVRGSTEWQHARVMRKVVNLDSGTGRKIVCGFADCERDGFENFKIVQHEHQRAARVDGKILRGDQLCEAIDAGVFPGIHRTYVFCSERHRAMFHFDHGTQGLAMLESRGGMYGYLPTGYRGGIL